MIKDIFKDTKAFTLGFIEMVKISGGEYNYLSGRR